MNVVGRKLGRSDERRAQRDERRGGLAGKGVRACDLWGAKTRKENNNIPTNQPVDTQSGRCGTRLAWRGDRDGDRKNRRQQAGRRGRRRTRDIHAADGKNKGAVFVVFRQSKTK